VCVLHPSQSQWQFSKSKAPFQLSQKRISASVTGGFSVVSWLPGPLLVVGGKGGNFHMGMLYIYITYITHLFRQMLEWGREKGRVNGSSDSFFLDTPFHNNPGSTTDFISKIQTIKDFLGTQFTIESWIYCSLQAPPKKSKKKLGTCNTQFEATESLTDFVRWHLGSRNAILKFMEFADCEKKNAAK